MNGKKIINGLKEAVRVSRCEHDFQYLHESRMGGLVALCTVCRCRFTAWPGSVHYAEIAAARDAQKASP